MAGANRYTKLYDPGVVRGPEYVPLPFDDLKAVGAAKQHQYDSTNEDIYNTQKMFKINADPANREYRDKKVAEYNNKLASIADEFHKKGEVGQMPAKIRSLARDYANDPEVVGLNQSYENYLKSQTDVDKLKSDRKFDPMYDTYGQYSNNYNPLKQGFKPFDYKGTMSTADYIKPADEAMKDVAKHGSESGAYSIDNSGNVIGHKQGWQGVLRNDIQRVAKANVEPFLQTPEAGYLIDRIRHQNPNASSEDIKQQVYNLLLERGEKQIGGISKSDSDFKYAPSDIRKEQKANETTSTQSEGLNQAISYNKALDDLSFEGGKLKMPKTSEFKNTPRRDEFGILDPNHVERVGSKDDPQKLQEHQALVNGLKQQYSLEGNDEEVVNAYKSAVKSLTNESIPLRSISNLSSKGLGESISRNLDQRNIYIKDSKGETTDGTLATVLDKLDISEEDFRKSIKSGLAGYSQAGPTPGAMYAEVKDSDGNTRRIFISPDEEQKKIFQTSHALNEARKSLQPTTIRPYTNNPDIGYQVVPKISKKGEPSWDYYLGKFENNKFIPAQKVDLDNIRKQEREVLKESNYLGSQIGDSKDEQKDVD